METNDNQVTNPLQAASEVFYRPKAVFNALGPAANWSWIPFIIVLAMLMIPTYLYYDIVDGEWLVEFMAQQQLPDGSPAEIENRKSMIPVEGLKYSAFAIPIVMIIMNAIFAAYYTFVTRNDDKSVYGFTDWYGATWWFSMPAVVSGLFSLMLLAMQDAGAQIPMDYTAPLSVAFIFGVDMSSSLYNWCMNLRLDTIWSVILTAYCIASWTHFSFKKCVILASIPIVIILSLTLLFAL